MEAQAFRAALKAPYPVLSDEDQRAYQMFGLGHISGPFTLSDVGSLAGEIVRHGGAFSHTQDMSQLGGTVVVDASGVIRFIHRSQRPSDNVPAEDIIAAIQTAE